MIGFVIAILALIVFGEVAYIVYKKGGDENLW